jgi:hypothetical protein
MESLFIKNTLKLCNWFSFPFKVEFFKMMLLKTNVALD